MKRLFEIILILLFLISTKLYAQDTTQNSSPSYTIKPKDEIWRERYNFGLSTGYPQIPFLNMGMKFYDKVYIEFFFELNETNKYSSFFDIGYQSNHLFNKNIRGQIGIGLMQIPNKDETDKLNKFGVNLKVTKTVAKYFGFYLSSHIGVPDKRTTYDNLANVNLGFEFYFRHLPLLGY